MMSAGERTRAFMEDLFVVLEQEGWSTGFLATLHEEVVFNAMGRSPVAGRYEGKEAYRQLLARLHARLAVAPRLETISIMADGNKAVARFRSHGGIGVNGADFSMDYGWVFHIARRKIREIWGYYDTAKMEGLFAG